MNAEDNSPYHFQRQRHQIGEYPRPPQPNTSQPNAKPKVTGWGISSMEYWGGISQGYWDRQNSRKAAQSTNLELGRI